MRILCSFVGGAGHYEPLVPIARAAGAAGHEVRFACRASMVATVVADGFDAVAVGPDVPEPTAIGPLVAPDPVLEDLVLSEGFAGRTALLRARDLVEVLAEMGPAVVVADEVDYGAMVAAERFGVPYATVLVLVAGSFIRPTVIGPSIERVRAKMGLGPDPALDMLTRHLVVAPGPPSFRDRQHPLPPTAHAIRPAVLSGPPPDEPPSVIEDLGDRPAVYVTLGTIFNMESGDLFPRLLDAVGDLPIDVVATVGRQVDPATLGDHPANVRLERFVPQAWVLPHVDAVVSHAGSGSVMGALAFGLPSVLLPMGGDQMHNAERCAQLDVAVVLDPVAATPDAIAAAITSVLGDGGRRERARQLQAEARALPDPATVVPLLEELVGPSARYT